MKKALAALIALISCTSIYAQTCDPTNTPPVLSAGQAWQQGNTIVVNIDQSFDATHIAAVEVAFGNWQGAVKGSDNVTFAQFNIVAIQDSGNGTPATSKGQYVVSASPPRDSKGNLLPNAGDSTFGPDQNNLARGSQAWTMMNPKIGNLTTFEEVMEHAIGHTFGLADCPLCADGESVMKSPLTSFNDTKTLAGFPQACEVQKANSVAPPAPPPPPPPPPHHHPCFVDGDPCDCNTGEVDGCSPIVIDTEGEGFHLTAVEDGVLFDIRGDGHPIKIAWTAPRYHNAFLVLDRNGDGKIESGKELFGNFTQQPNSDHPNGFLALAEFDNPANGGNGDELIDEHDAVFSKLRLWIDENHDGVCQSGELHTLAEFGINSLSLQYYDARRTDAFGNQFRYRALVNPGEHRDFRDWRQHEDRGKHQVGRWAYDVFFK